MPETQPTVTEAPMQEVFTSLAYGSIRISLPADWEYEEVLDDCRCPDSEHCFGIDFHPAEDPNAVFTLRCFSRPIGICGTGVDFSDAAFAQGYQATKCVENDWHLLIFQDVPGYFSLEYTLDAATREKYEPVLNKIIGTAVFTEDSISCAAVLSLAAKTLNADYPLLAGYDFRTGIWEVQYANDAGKPGEEPFPDHVCFDYLGNPLTCD